MKIFRISDQYALEKYLEIIVFIMIGLIADDTSLSKSRQKN